MAAPWLKSQHAMPTWEGLVPTLLAVFENGTELGKQKAREEILDIARKLDAMNQKYGGRP